MAFGEDDPVPDPNEDILSQIQDILASLFGLDTRVTELEDKVAELQEKMDNLLPEQPQPPGETPFFSDN